MQDKILEILSKYDPVESDDYTYEASLLARFIHCPEETLKEVIMDIFDNTFFPPCNKVISNSQIIFTELLKLRNMQ